MPRLPSTVFIFVSMLLFLFGMWGPYRWPTVGVRVRRDSGLEAESHGSSKIWIEPEPAER